MKLGKCSGVNRDGAACSAQARPGRDHCAWHDPALAADRRAWRQKGGAGRSVTQRAKKALGDAGDLVTVQAKLVGALEKVEDGTLDPARATAMASLARAIVAVAVPGELSERLAAMERALARGSAS